jgi:hypothetical protein
MKMDLGIFERTRHRIAAGKDFPPEMVAELCSAYDELLGKGEQIEPGQARVVGAAQIPTTTMTLGPDSSKQEDESEA